MWGVPVQETKFHSLPPAVPHLPKLEILAKSVENILTATLFLVEDPVYCVATLWQSCHA